MTEPKEIAFNEQIGQILKAKRINAGMSQADLGKSLGVTFQQVQKYENGSNGLSIFRLQQVCEVLCLSPATFFTTTNEEREPKVPLALTRGYSKLGESHKAAVLSLVSSLGKS